MDRYQEIETVEEWRIRVRCSVEEVPYVAASIPKMVAGMTGCYQGDVIHHHVHQALPPPVEEVPMLSHQRQMSLSRNGSYVHQRG